MLNQQREEDNVSIDLDTPYDISNENNRGYCRVVRFTARDGSPKEIQIPLGDIYRDGGEVARRLADEGLRFPNPRTLLDTLRKADPERVEKYASKPGWFGSSFVLPDETFGSSQKIPIIGHNKNPFTVSGTVEEWREHIGQYCSGNSMLVFAVSVALAGPLMRLVGEPSGGFHLYGRNGRGKSTALYVAASVWGGRNGCFHRWRTTDNALEGVAVLHNDGLLCLDELKQAEGKALGNMIYMLANEQGKNRLTKDGDSRDTKTWRLLALSTGEASAEDLIKDAGQQYFGGQEARLTPLSADAGHGLGLFENIHGFKEAGDFAKMLDFKTQQYHGAAIREFLRCLTSEATLPAGIRQLLRMEENLTASLFKALKAIQNAITPDRASVEVRRVAGRFATVGLAGELATSMGITGWREGEAIEAAQRLIGEWSDGRGSSASSDDEAVMDRVRGFIQQHSKTPRLPRLSEDMASIHANDRAYNLAGYTLERKKHGTVFLFIPKVFREEICKGNLKMALDALLKDGYLEPDPSEAGNRNRRRMRVLGSNQYFYCIKASILEERAAAESGSGDNLRDDLEAGTMGTGNIYTASELRQ